MLSVVWEERSNPSPRIVAHPTDDAPLQILSGPETERVELYFYAENLETLELVRGTVEPAPPCQRNCRLLEPKLGERYARADDEWVRVSQFEGLAAELRELLVSDHAVRCGAQCLRLEPTLLPIGDREAILTTLIEPRAAVVFMSDGSTVLVSDDGRTQPGCRLPPGEAAAGVWNDERGKLWLSRESGELLLIEVSSLWNEGECQVTPGPQPPENAVFNHFAGAPYPEESLEVFALSTTRGLWRLFGGTWEYLGGFTDEILERPSARRRVGRVFWLGPGRAAAFQKSSEVLLSEGGRLRSVRYSDLPGRSELAAGTRRLDGGWLLSVTDFGLIQMAEIGGPWSTYAENRARRPTALLEHRGFTMVGSINQLEVHHPTLGFCAKLFHPSEDYVHQLLEFPHAPAVLLADYEDTRQATWNPMRSLLFIRTKMACDSP